VASALVLHHDAQDVWQRPDASEATDATARTRLGQYRDGSGHGQEATRVAEVYSVGEGENRLACWMSVLS